jgi:hypothetical protein
MSLSMHPHPSSVLPLLEPQASPSSSSGIRFGHAGTHTLGQAVALLQHVPREFQRTNVHPDAYFPHSIAASFTARWFSD